MSNIHVLDSNPSDGTTRIALHFSTPSGNNTAGISWADAIKAAALNTSVMSVGNGGGQIPTAESNQIIAGTVFEYVTSFLPDPFSNASRLAQLDALHTQSQPMVATNMRARLQYYGFTR